MESYQLSIWRGVSALVYHFPPLWCYVSVLLTRATVGCNGCGCICSTPSSTASSAATTATSSATSSAPSTTWLYTRDELMVSIDLLLNVLTPPGFLVFGLTGRSDETVRIGTWSRPGCLNVAMWWHLAIA